ncbi:MAG TPA: hypothetical protein VND70_00745 [Acidimicrobiales bacterium]|nr:hypothetical protein [Acidimicrobiales bacterium]
MTSSDWIAVSSALIAMLAFALGYRSYRLQKTSAEGDAQGQLDGLISTLTNLLGKAFAQNIPPVSPGSPAVNVSVQGTMAELQVVGSQAHQLLHPTDPSDSCPELGWYSAYVLANTFEQVWHMKRAGEYWDEAVRLSAGEPQAQFVALQGRAMHRFGRNNDGDIALGRIDYDSALNLLDPGSQGIDATREQTVGLYVSRAACEQGVGNGSVVVDCIWDAWAAALSINTPWRHLRAGAYVCGFILQSGGVEWFLDHKRPLAEEMVLQGSFNAWKEQMMRQQVPTMPGVNRGP